MIKYATVKVGAISPLPKDVSTLRAAFFNTITFNIGGHYYTFAEWKHGFLRGNVKSPRNGITLVPFSKADPRAQHVVSIPDPRVLLCLATNHGPGGCPELGTYTTDNLDEELTISAESFCANDCNVRIDVKKRELHLSNIFSMNRNAFATEKNSLPLFISKYTRGSKKNALDAMIEDGKAIKIVDIPLDWRTLYCTERYLFDVESLNLDETKGSSGGFLKLSPRKSIIKKLPMEQTMFSV
jgi:Protein of unknown function, DUF547